MNWIGGPSNHFRRINDDQKKQKEFFERKRRADRSQLAVSCTSTPGERKKGVSRDILHLQCVKETKRDLSHGKSFVSHFSPDAKSRRRVVGSITTRNQAGYVHEKSNGRHHGGKVSRRYKEIRHLPNVSPCNQSSTIEFVDTTDDDRAEPRQTFRHLPSYQSTPIFGLTRQKRSEPPQKRQQQTPYRTLKGYNAGTRLASPDRSSPSRDVRRCNQHKPRFCTPPPFEEGFGGAAAKSHRFLLDDAVSHDFKRANSPNAPIYADRSAKRVNFSRVNQYHSASEDSLIDPYSIFESFLHPTTRAGRHPSPNFEQSANNRSALSSSSFGVAWQPVSEVCHEIIDQESFLVCPDSNRRDLVTSVSVKSAGKETSGGFFAMDDRTPSMLQWDGHDAAEINFNKKRFEFGDELTSAIDFPEPNSLKHWLQSTTSVVELSSPNSSQNLIPLPKLVSSEDLIMQRPAIEDAPGRPQSGASGEVMLLHDEEIPGLDTKASPGWLKTKYRENISTPVNSQENCDPRVINDEDGLPPLGDGQAPPKVENFADLVAVMTGGKGLEGSSLVMISRETSPAAGKNAGENQTLSEHQSREEVSDILARASVKLRSFSEREKPPKTSRVDVAQLSKSADAGAREYRDAACSPFPAEIRVENAAKVCADAETQTESYSPRRRLVVRLGERVTSESSHNVNAKKRQQPRSASQASDSDD